MKFSVILSIGFAALVAAQSSSSSTTSAAPAPTDRTTICLNKCSENDTDCKAKCVGVPNPNADMANATNACVAGCPKGNGTEVEIQTYSDCVKSCIANQYWSSSSAGASATATTKTGTAATASGSATTTRAGASGSASASATGSSAPGSAAVAGFTVTGSFIGLFAMAAGLIVL